MAANRRKESSAVRFGPLLKVCLLCGFFGGAALGYVWQKNQIAQLDREIGDARKELDQQVLRNRQKSDLIATLESHRELERRTAEFRLGLEPTRQEQIVHLPEPPDAAPGRESAVRAGQFALRDESAAGAF